MEMPWINFVPGIEGAFSQRNKGSPLGCAPAERDRTLFTDKGLCVLRSFFDQLTPCQIVFGTVLL